MHAHRIPLFRRDGSIVAYAVTDHDLAPVLGGVRWHRNSNGYATTGAGGGTGGMILMHRLVLGLAPGDGQEGDHISRDKLDNRRANLRTVTHAQNMQNRRSHVGSTSRFRGVHWRPDRGCWRVRPRVNGQYVHVGYFDSEVAAALAAESWRREHMPFAEVDPELVKALGERDQLRDAA